MHVKIGKTQRPYAASGGQYQFTEGTLTLPGHDADLNIVFPGGQRAVLQWRLDGPSIDLCFDQPLDVFNQAEDMHPAPAKRGRAEQHVGVVQLTIPLRPDFTEEVKA